ncbi:MAG: hypothetical protein IPG87_17695 [Saprospiraceae bacterium]|nr:hypothetical protein [Candidatus Vicinibacter affinis]
MAAISNNLSTIPSGSMRMVESRKRANGWHPLIDFKEGGLHNGRFILKPGTNCSDTVQFQVNVILPFSRTSA